MEQEKLMRAYENTIMTLTRRLRLYEKLHPEVEKEQPAVLLTRMEASQADAGAYSRLVHERNNFEQNLVRCEDAKMTLLNENIQLKEKLKQYKFL